MTTTILINLFILIAGIISLRLSYKLQIKNKEQEKRLDSFAELINLTTKEFEEEDFDKLEIEYVSKKYLIVKK